LVHENTEKFFYTREGRFEVYQEGNG